MSDDMLRYRSLFPITEKSAFLAHCAVSPLNRRISEAVHAHLQMVEEVPFPACVGSLRDLFGELKQRLASLINARGTDEIVLMPNTAAGINTAAVSLPVQAGDNVLVLDGDYPANIYPWMNLAYRGVLTKVVPQHEGGLDVNRLEQRIDKRTRVIALSTAMFATGFRNDIAAVGQLCQERGIYFVVDAIQTLGAFPIDVQACHVDFLAAGSQKWLLSSPGMGFLYCRRELLDELQPGAYVGASSVVDPFNYLDYNLTAPPSAERFNMGTPNWIGMIALNTSLKLLEEVGCTRVEQQVRQLVDIAINDLAERGYGFAASTAPEHRSGIVVARMHDPAGAAEQLNQEGVVVTQRGPGLRIAPHFYNTPEEVLRVGEALERHSVQPC
jgi:selenocysteine lyase/cysteine desulfurase